MKKIQNFIFCLTSISIFQDIGPRMKCVNSLSCTSLTRIWIPTYYAWMRKWVEMVQGLLVCTDNMSGGKTEAARSISMKV